MNNDALTAKLLAEHYQAGVKEERERIIKLIKELLPKYYEDGADEFAKQLEFALKDKAEVKK